MKNFVKEAIAAILFASSASFTTAQTNDCPGDTGTLVDVAVSLGTEFTTLVSLAQLVPGLIETLSDPNGTFTLFGKVFDSLFNDTVVFDVFYTLKYVCSHHMLTFVSIKYVCTAPTNTAFGQLADDIPGVTDLLTNDIDLLQKVLGYHLLLDEVPSSAITTGPVETSIGEDLEFTLEMTGGVTITDSYDRDANVVVPDREACNGVAHAIDRVLLPENFPSETCKTIVEIAAGLPEFSTLVSLVSAVPDLAALLSDPDSGPFTLFGKLS